MVLKSRNLINEDETPRTLVEIMASEIAGALFPVIKVVGNDEESFIDFETLQI